MRRIGGSREGRAAAEDSHGMGDIEKYQMYFYVIYIGEEEISVGGIANEAHCCRMYHRFEIGLVKASPRLVYT